MKNFTKLSQSKEIAIARAWPGRRTGGQLPAYQRNSQVATEITAVQNTMAATNNGTTPSPILGSVTCGSMNATLPKTKSIGHRRPG